MRRTRPFTLVIAGGAALVLVFFVQSVLVAAGRPRYEPPLLLALPLVVIAVAVVLMAVPVWRAPRRPGGRIDPFYATRVVLFAKACAIAGAVFAGAGLGLLAFLLLRALPSGGGVLVLLAVTGGAALMLAGGIVAEQLCRLPPGDSGEDGPDAEAG